MNPLDRVWGRWVRVSAVAAAVVLGALAPAACVDDEDPLSVEALQRVARAQGDAVGRDFGGTYVVRGEARSCDCPTVAVPEAGGLELCALLNVESEDLPAELRQYDGLMVLELGVTSALLGGIDGDGSFAAASILSAGVLGAGGEILSRIDGEVSDLGFAGDLVIRFIGEFAGEKIDCRAWSVLTAERND